MPSIILFCLLVLVAGAVPIAAVLGILGLGLDEVFMRGRRALMLGDFVWEQSIQYILVSVPMFILLGEIMLRAGIAQRMYAAVATWLSWLPGGLMHANIGSCAIFAATSGSSVATVATVATATSCPSCRDPSTVAGRRTTIGKEAVLGGLADAA